MRKTVNIAGVKVDSVTMAQAVENLKSFINESGVHSIYTPNAEIVMEAYSDENLRSILNQSDMLVADGAGVILASRILGLDLPEKVSGIDLIKESFSMDIGRKTRYFFFGSKPGVAETAAANISAAHPGIETVGCRNGYFSKEEEPGIIEEINAAAPDILLVALGAPKQEKWIHENRHKLKAKVCIGCGGTLDVFAGKAKLAPEYIRKAGFEWLYRLCHEPWRFKRMMKLPKFILLVTAMKLKLVKSPQ